MCTWSESTNARTIAKATGTTNNVALVITEEAKRRHQKEKENIQKRTKEMGPNGLGTEAIRKRRIRGKRHKQKKRKYQKKTLNTNRGGKDEPMEGAEHKRRTHHLCICSSNERQRKRINKQF